MEHTYKIIIAGGRDFADYDLLKRKLDRIISEKSSLFAIEIVTGKAKGADALGEQYAYERHYGIKEFPADWTTGKSAGFIRNGKMAEYADACICFWDGQSKGTKHMIGLAKSHGLQLRVIGYNRED